MAFSFQENPFRRHFPGHTFITPHSPWEGGDGAICRIIVFSETLRVDKDQRRRGDLRVVCQRLDQICISRPSNKAVFGWRGVVDVHVEENERAGIRFVTSQSLQSPRS